MQVWFQNRRAKWKKRKKTTNVFRSPGALLPSHGLPPFGAMSSELCGAAGMFHAPTDRWGMGPGRISLFTHSIKILKELIQNKPAISSFFCFLQLRSWTAGSRRHGHGWIWPKSWTTWSAEFRKSWFQSRYQ